MHAAALRLLNVNSYHYRRGGADHVYLDHAALMAGLGWQNAFFAMRHPRNLPCAWSDYFVDEIEFGHDYSLGQTIIKATQVIWSFEARRQLRRLLQAFRPDVAHLHNIYHHLSPAILPVLRAAGVPTVMTAHDLKIACPNNKMFTPRAGVCEACRGGNFRHVVRQRCIHGSVLASTVVALEATLARWLDSYARNLDCIVVPSQFYLNKFVAWGWPRSLFRYIPNWIDAACIAPQTAPGQYCVYVGRLVPEKGVETLVRAAMASGVRLAIVGDGPLRAGLQSLLEQGPGQIELMGHQTGAALQSIVAGARAVVVPSQWYENAPLSVLEAFAAGKPVLGSRIGGIPELIDEGETGWLFEPGSSDALAQALQKVMATPDGSVQSMGACARARVLRDFSRERYVEAMLALYRDIGSRLAKPMDHASRDGCAG